MVDDVSQATTIALSPGNGTTESGTLATGLSTNLYQFSGTAGERLYFRSLGDSPSFAAYDTLYNPVNGSVYSNYADSDNPITLPSTGTYLLAVAGLSGSNASVSYSFELFQNVDPTVSGTLPLSASGTIANPGDEATYTFTAAAGQRIFVDGLGTSISGLNATLTDPFGNTIFNNTAASDDGPYTLTLPGTYTLTVYSSGTSRATGKYALVVDDVAAATAITLTSGSGTTETGTLATGVSDNLYQFSGTAGERLYITGLSDSPSFAAYYTIFSAANNSITSDYVDQDNSFTLPSTGTFLLSVAGQNGNNASVNYSFEVFQNVDPTVPGSLPLTASGTIANPGDEASFTFTGSAGQRIFVDGIATSINGLNAMLTDPFGNQIFNNNASIDEGPFTLSLPGTYTLTVYSSGTSKATGNYQLVVYDAAAATSVTLTSGSSTTVSGTLSSGLATNLYRFTGSAGERLYFESLSDTPAFASQFFVYNQANGNILNNYVDRDGTLTLPANGVYLLAVSGQSASNSSVSYSFEIFENVDPTVAGSLPLTASGTITNPGDEATYTFTGSAGQRIFVDGSGASISNLNAILTDPYGTTIFNSNAASDVGPFTLNLAGTYTLTVYSNSTARATGNYNLVVEDAATATGITLTPGAGTVVSGNLTTGTTTNLYQFSGTANERIFFQGISDSPTDAAVVNFYNVANGNFVAMYAESNGSVTLPSSGTYLMSVAGQNATNTSASYKFELFDNVDPTSTLSLNSEVTGSLTNPGDEVSYTFTGSVGQQIQFNGLESGSIQIATLFDPFNGTVFGSYLQSNAGPYTLTTPGTYTLVLTTNGRNSGNFDFRLLDLQSETKLQVNTTEADLTVTLSAASTQQVLVQYATADGTATAAGGDYKPATGVVLFQPGQTTATIEVQAIDQFTTQTTNFDVNLSNPVGATIASGGGTGVVTIIGNGQGTINGEIFSDVNGNGTLDGGEAGLAGWTINLLNSSNSVVATTTTVSGGDYTFTGVPAGSYTLQEQVQPGYLQTAPAAPGTIPVTIAAGQTINNLNFGDFQAVTLSGEVFTDTNDNGTLDSGEPGIAGWTVDLLNSSAQVVAATTTDSHGDFAFAGVGPGTFTVKEVLQNNFIPTSSPATYSEKTSGGQNVGGLVFGIYQLATFSGEVFNDSNGNGAIDGGEAGIAGWTVELLNSSNAVAASTTTDSGGNYSFTGVGPGSYTIEEVQQSGYSPTTATTIAVAAASGLVSTGNNFGEFQISTLSGEAYNDLNGNGTLDSGDNALSGWTVNLLNSSSQIVDSTTTDSHGDYTFTVKNPGTYTVEEVLQPGYILTAPASGSYTEALNSGQSAANLNFGDFQTVTFSGEAYNDNNGDGSLGGGEPGLAGWTVDLLNSSNQVVATTKTDSNGDYAFSSVGPGSYSIQIVELAGYVQSSTPLVFNETALGGQNVANLNFGEFQTVTLGGEVYEDVNGDGTPESGEAGLAGWTVNLLNTSNQVVATTTTNSNGVYSFPGLGPGSKTIQVVEQAGFISSGPASYTVPLTSGLNASSFNFGEVHPGTISGEAFNDLNGNGTFDSGEPGLANWTVDLFRNGSGLVASTTTDANGVYSFSAVGVGAYTIQEVVQNGYVETTSPSTYGVTTTEGGHVSNLNFGDFQTVTLGGQVYNDSNADGTLDNGELGLAGWSVKLLNSSSQVVASTTTDSSGDYTLSGVGPGTYTVNEVLQTGYIETSLPASYSVATSSGQNVAKLNFGNLVAESVSGEAYNDLNGDGTLNSGEPGLAGWTVNLLNSSSQVVATTTTDSHGNYAFTITTPGSYTVQEVLQSGFAFTAPASGTYAETLTAGQSVTGLNFGNFQSVTLSGEVYSDLNDNGALNSGEPGLSGWTVNLLNSSSSVVATTTTESNGDYSFTVSKPGTYTVKEVVQSGYTLTEPAAGSYPETLSSGQSVAGLQFGNFAAVTPTTTVVTPASASVGFGQAVTFTATVSSSNGTPPDGSVQFLVNGTNFGSPVALSGATAQIAIAEPAGSYTVTAEYTGDTHFGATLPGAETGAALVVTPAVTTTVVTPKTVSASAGQSVTFTATISSTDGTPPSGFVQFLVAGAAFGSPVPLSGTTAQLAITEGVGSYTVAAEFTGTANFAATLPADETTAALTVTSATLVSIAVTPASPSITKGLTQQFTATGTYTDSSHADLTSQVTWASATPAVATISATGLATALTGGTTAITATFGGVASPTDTLTVLKAATSTVVTPSSGSDTYGQSTTFTAAVSSAAGTPPDGTVQFLVDGTNYGSPVPVSVGTAQLAISEPVGTFTISAQYTGDGSYAATLPGVETAATLTVSPAATTTSLSPASSSVPSGQSASFTAVVTSSSAGRPPDGTVQFLVNGSNFGSPVTVSGGTAVLAITEPVGSYSVTAQYAGDGTNYAKSAVSSASSLTVTTAFTKTATSTVVTPALATISFGQSDSFTATVSSASGTPPDGSVQFLVNGANYGNPVPITGGMAQAAITEPAGTYSIKARYSGDNTFAATAAPDETGATLTVTPATTTTNLSPGSASINTAQSQTFTALIASPAVRRPTVPSSSWSMARTTEPRCRSRPAWPN